MRLFDTDRVSGLFSGQFRQRLWVVVLLCTAWLAIAWYASQTYIDRQQHLSFEQSLSDAKDEFATVSASTDNHIAMLQKIPRYLAKEAWVQRGLARFGPSVTASAVDYEQRKSAWEHDKELAVMSQQLKVGADILPPDVLWVLNAAGDCVAASNAGAKNSFVGTHYSDRAYFRETLSGGDGQQYAVGRVSNIPGLFYSSAVMSKTGQFLGTLVVKSDVPNLAPLLRNSHVFFADLNGVVILAEDKSLVNRVLPDARFNTLSESARIAQYKRSDLPALSFVPWRQNSWPELVRRDSEEVPQILLSSTAYQNGMGVYLLRDVPDILRLEQLRLSSFVFVALLGIFLIIALAVSAFYLDFLRRAKREAEKNQHELQLAKDAAESASIAKSQFLAVMSHEIRTPMNGILGMAQMLLMDQVSEEDRQDYARTILSSGQTLLGLLNDILDLSKIEAGRLELAMSVVNPVDVLSETKHLFQKNAQEKGLHLAFDWQGEASCYLADLHRLRQMLSNLTNNAIKFTAQGQVVLQAREIERSGTKALLEFSVEDTGIGIPEDKLNHLFEAFSQVDGSITRQFGGTGLGLSIVRSLATKMGGSVGVESTFGAGSRFWFRIYADQVNVETPQNNDAVVNDSAVLTAVALKGNILVVEDNPMNQKVIQALLGKLGLACQVVSNGQAGVEFVMHNPSIDLILMDVQMPVMDGYQATKNIRAWEMGQQGHRTIIALTADAFDEDRKRCLDAGMDDFLVKPVSLDKLRLALQRWLSR